MMRKASHYNIIFSLAAVAATMVAASFTGLAYGHAHMTITPTEENANAISVVIGHTNEPTYGAHAGIYMTASTMSKCSWKMRQLHFRFQART